MHSKTTLVIRSDRVHLRIASSDHLQCIINDQPKELYCRRTQSTLFVPSSVLVPFSGAARLNGRPAAVFSENCSIELSASVSVTKKPSAHSITHLRMIEPVVVKSMIELSENNVEFK